MRNLIYIFILIVIYSCSKSTQQVNYDFISEYRYPVDSLINPKVFVFQTSDSTNKLAFFLNEVKIEGNNKIDIYARLNNNNTSPIRDSFVSYYQDKSLILKDDYTLVRDADTNLDRVIKNKIIRFIMHSNKRIIKTEYESPYNESIISRSTKIDTIVKNDTVNIFNKVIPCVIVAFKIHQFTKIKYVPFSGKNFEKSGEAIYAKGIGLVSYYIENHSFNTIYFTRLKEIIDYKTYKERYCENTE